MNREDAPLAAQAKTFPASSSRAASMLWQGIKLPYDLAVGTVNYAQNLGNRIDEMQKWKQVQGVDGQPLYQAPNGDLYTEQQYWKQLAQTAWEVTLLAGMPGSGGGSATAASGGIASKASKVLQAAERAAPAETAAAKAAATESVAAKSMQPSLPTSAPTARGTGVSAPTSLPTQKAPSAAIPMEPGPALPTSAPTVPAGVAVPTRTPTIAGTGVPVSQAEIDATRAAVLKNVQPPTPPPPGRAPLPQPTAVPPAIPVSAPASPIAPGSVPQAALSSFGKFSNWARANKAKVGLGALAAPAALYGLYKLLTGKDAQQQESDAEQGNAPAQAAVPTAAAPAAAVPATAAPDAAAAAAPVPPNAKGAGANAVASKGGATPRLAAASMGVKTKVGAGGAGGMGGANQGGAAGMPQPTATPYVPRNGMGQPNYNYYADMMNSADEVNAYNRDLVNLRETARQAAIEAGRRGEKFQFVPVKDVKNNRVYFVNANGNDVALDMNDQGDRERYNRLVESSGIDPIHMSDWMSRSSRPLMRHVVPGGGYYDTNPDFGYHRKRAEESVQTQENKLQFGEQQAANESKQMQPTSVATVLPDIAHVEQTAGKNLPTFESLRAGRYAQENPFVPKTESPLTSVADVLRQGNMTPEEEAKRFGQWDYETNEFKSQIPSQPETPPTSLKLKTKTKNKRVR
jgi:hypothetical protein